MWKWVKRIAAVLVGIVALAVLLGFGYERFARWRVARSVVPPGSLVEVDGQRFHLDCRGEGTPTVLLEAGLDAGGSQSWATIHSTLAADTRTCAYDRAGIMWSDPGPQPRDALQIADELHALLAAAGESPPYVLAGHSLGGLLARVYRDRHPDQVAGLVLVDSSHPEQFGRFPQAVQEAMKPPPLLLLRLMANLGVLRLNAPPPPPPLPATTGEAVAALFVPSLPGMMAEMAVLDTIAAQAGGTGELGDLPLVVLSAGRHPGDGRLDPETLQEVAGIWGELQAELAALSTNADHRTLTDAAHYLHWDDPEAVVRGILDVVEAARGGGTVAAAPPPS